MSYMLEVFRNTNSKHRVKITAEFYKDVKWWLKYLPMFNGIGIMWMQHISKPDKILASDACLIGIGAICESEYIKTQFPPEWQNLHIAYLELLAVIVACKTWTEEIRHK